MKVSVIIPVYKVECFIVRCVTSLMKQTLQEVEYIFVNDATPDNSVRLIQEVVECFPERRNKVILLHHDVNKGLPAARNTGLAIAEGEYIYHCDSDDFVEPEMLEQLYNKAKEKNADIVWCDWWLSFRKKERYMKQPDYSNSLDALKGMLSGAMKYNVWNKLIRRSLYVEHNIAFPSGFGMGEDMTMIRLFARACEVAYLPKAFYHYAQFNMGALSKTHSERHLTDISHNVSVVLDDLHSLFGEQLEREIFFFQLNVKFPFLITDDWSLYHLWQSWYPGANKYIMQNKKLSLRSRCLQWMAWKYQFWAVWLYYKCIYRLVYGIIYR